MPKGLLGAARHWIARPEDKVNSAMRPIGLGGLSPTKTVLYAQLPDGLEVEVPAQPSDDLVDVLSGVAGFDVRKHPGFQAWAAPQPAGYEIRPIEAVDPLHAEDVELVGESEADRRTMREIADIGYSERPFVELQTGQNPSSIAYDEGYEVADAVRRAKQIMQHNGIVAEDVTKLPVGYRLYLPPDDLEVDELYEREYDAADAADAAYQASVTEQDQDDFARYFGQPSGTETKLRFPTVLEPEARSPLREMMVQPTELLGSLNPRSNALVMDYTAANSMSESLPIELDLSKFLPGDQIITDAAVITIDERGLPEVSFRPGYETGRDAGALGPIIIPRRPSDVDLAQNIAAARANYLNLPWFRSQVRNSGVWDYKQDSEHYIPFGNFNYGATGTALGVPPSVLLQRAGAAQVKAGTSRPGYGKPGVPFVPATGSHSYGDDPVDQFWISQGRRYRYGSNSPWSNVQTRSRR